MNSKGQTLILFVILIPILLFFAALVIDVGMLMNESIKLSGTTQMILKDLYGKRLDTDISDEVKLLYEKNQIPTDSLKIDGAKDYFVIQNEYSLDSIFGKLIGIQEYPVAVSKKAFYSHEKLVIKKE